MGTRGFKSSGWLLAGLFIAVLAAVVLVAPRLRPVPPVHHSKTSVLMLTLCTVRADHLGSYGYERDISPNLDRLAAAGFRFERVLAQAPWTKSGVASIVTGMYPRSLNIEDPRHLENYRSLHDGFTTMAEIMKDRGYHTIGVTANPNAAAVFNMDQGYDYFQDPRVLWQDRYRKQGIWNSDKVGRSFLDHLSDRPTGEKFFAHLVFVDAHSPWIHKVELEPEDNFEVPPVGSREPIDKYDVQISYLDGNIGDLLGELEERGYDDLLVIVNADHGEAFKEHHWVDNGHGRHLYNSTIWVPWILHHSKLNPPGRSHEPMVAQIDILPTLLDILGIDADDAIDGLSVLAGTSRWGDIRGEDPSAPIERSFSRTQFLGSDKVAVITPEHKLIINHDRGKKVDWRKRRSNKQTHYYPPEFELYRHRSDVLEQKNLIGIEPELEDQLRSALRQWEEAYPPLVPDEELNSSFVEVREQLSLLKALGYVAGDDEPDKDGGTSP